jgi:rhamnose transport system ATP-binding protein
VNNRLLSVSSIRKSFAGVQALKGVSFDLRAGEVHALVGENGAGKSTLIRIMTGAETMDGGAFEIAGVTVHQLDPAAAQALGIAAVYQQPTLFPHLSVSENMALGVERGMPWRRVDWPARRERAVDLLARVGASIDPNRSVDTLTMPEQQLVEIARALGADARILIMDEPTASLPAREVGMLLEVVRRLRAQGVGVVYVSHRLEEVFAVAGRITVLRDGQSVTTAATENLTANDLVRLMVGRDISAIFPTRPVAGGEVALEVRGLSSRAAGVHDISFTVRRGEILGIAGLVGSGRTPLAETLFGVWPADTGEIVVNGKRVEIRSPAEAIAHGLAYVPEDRRRHGVIADMSVCSNSSLASLNALTRAGCIDRAAERGLASQYVARLRIKTSSVDAPVGSLSGGNQQKVALARWLATNPSILVLDEPTQGVDVGSKSEIHALMEELAGQGLAIVMISSELPEILGMSDRIAVMRGGTIVATMPRAEATEQRVLACALEADTAARSA